MNSEATVQKQGTRNDLVAAMAEALQETFALYKRTHLAHFNVKGPTFSQLHAMFEEQYNDQWEAVDMIAERIRSLGADIDPAWLHTEPEPLETHADTLVTALANDNRGLSDRFNRVAKLAADVSDSATEDLCIERIRAHDQHAWMLEATSEA